MGIFSFMAGLIDGEKDKNKKNKAGCVAETVADESTVAAPAQPVAETDGGLVNCTVPAESPVKPIPEDETVPVSPAVSAKPSAVSLPASNSIETEDRVIFSVIDILSKSFRGKKMNFNDAELIVWVADNLLYMNIGNAEFKQRLMADLSVQKGFHFNSVDIKPLVSVAGVSCTKVMDNVYIELKEVGRVTPMHRARITVYMEQGELEKSEYILDSFAISELRTKAYNIGAGKLSRMENGMMRENHIVISSDQNSPMYELNKYVSRAHAHICFLDKYGFCLYVDPKGTKMARKRTRILRGTDTQIDMNNPLLPEPLQNGDIIELSKSVQLLFEVL